MEKIYNKQELTQICKAWKKKGQVIGLVPTMGFLHQGHLALVNQARQECDKLVVSIYVNPTQFGPQEDLEAYPVDIQRDLELLLGAGVDLVYLPDNKQMYAPGHSTWVEEQKLGLGLCGRSRPGHFRGVTTVVCKLFNQVRPDFGMFGQKDWQQLAVIKRMVRDLDMDTDIRSHPIVRENDGLALSSRNTYLGLEERKQAPQLYKGLNFLREKIQQGEQDVSLLAELGKDFWQRHLPLGQLDYLEFIDQEDLHGLQRIQGPALIAVAMRLGKARLIDNIEV